MGQKLYLHTPWRENMHITRSCMVWKLLPEPCHVLILYANSIRKGHIPLINTPRILCKILIPTYILSRKSLFYQRNNVCTALDKYYNDANLSNMEIWRSYSDPRLPDIHSFCLQPSPILFRTFLLIFYWHLHSSHLT